MSAEPAGLDGLPAFTCPTVAAWWRVELGPEGGLGTVGTMNRQEQWRATPRSVFQVATTESRDLHLAVLSLFAERELRHLPQQPRLRVTLRMFRLDGPSLSRVRR
jgi:hypothetical protein